MVRELVDAHADPAAEAIARIRAAVEETHEPLLRTIAVVVARSDRRKRWSQVMETASELLQEAVHEALKDASRFDPTRSATAWIRGIAVKCWLGRRRREQRSRRCVPATVLGDGAWAGVLAQLQTAPEDTVVARRIDLQEALSRIPAADRRAIELRYFQGLDGHELAHALGAATPGAARVRVCRALQALRSHLLTDDAETLP